MADKAQEKREEVRITVPIHFPFSFCSCATKPSSKHLKLELLVNDGRQRTGGKMNESWRLFFFFPYFLTSIPSCVSPQWKSLQELLLSNPQASPFRNCFSFLFLLFLGVCTFSRVLLLAMLGSATGESSQLPIEPWAQAPEKKKSTTTTKKERKRREKQQKKNVRGWLKKKKAMLFYCWNNVDTNRPGRKHGRLHSDVKVNIATTTQATDESISSLDQCEGACKEIKCICPLLRNTEHDTEVHPVLQSRSITYSNSAKKKKKHMREETERRISVCVCVCVCFRQAATVAIIVKIGRASCRERV